MKDKRRPITMTANISGCLVGTMLNVSKNFKLWNMFAFSKIYSVYYYPKTFICVLLY